MRTSRRAPQCSVVTDTGICGHPTWNPNGDCGRHGPSTELDRAAATRAQDSAKTAAIAAANDPQDFDELFDVAARLASRDEESDVDGRWLSGSLNRNSEREHSEHQERLAGQLNDIFDGDAWQRTMKVKAKLAKHPGLRGRGNQILALHHVLMNGGQGIVLPRSKWAELGRTVRDDCQGFAVWVPRQWAKEVPVEGASETDEGTEETETVTGTAFQLGGSRGQARYYDISETEGAELADEAWARAAREVNAPTEETAQHFLAEMSDAAELAGCKITEMPAASLPPTKMGHISLTTNEIVLRDDMTPAAKAATLAHELAHHFDPALRRHAGPDGSAEERAKVYHRTRDECEFVAESVAYAVSAHYGVDTSRSSAEYLHNWRPDDLRQAKKLYERAESSMDMILGIGNRKKKSREQQT